MEIEFWEDVRGFSPAREFIIKQTNKRQKLIRKRIEYYEKYGLQNLLQSKVAKEIRGIKSQYGFSLFELKPVPFRFFFVCVVATDIMILLNGFVKKTNHTPDNEINKALNIAQKLKDKYLLK